MSGDHDQPGRSELVDRYLGEVSSRLEALAADARDGALDPAIALMVRAIDAGGVVQAFSTGHSEAFAMEIAGRAGGLVPTNKIALRDLVLHGGRGVELLGGSGLERDDSLVEELFDLSPVGRDDVFMIASNSGVNGSIVGLALLAQARGHQVIAVTSLEHTSQVEPKHPSGRRLCDVADVVLDNRAPFGDATVQLSGGVAVGAVSSLTAAFLAQLLTIGVVQQLADRGAKPPVYLSANIPEGDEHNRKLEDLYRDKIRREA
jgi:uncharacterized phosphosugar-binding protein